MPIDYLRFSITDRCNLNCVYCTPLDKRRFLDRSEVLSYEQMYRVVKIFTQAGIKKIRITGGEPLFKRDVVSFIEMLKTIKGLEEISMTTNGVCLKSYARQLKEAGLDRLNISLDTLKEERFKTITGFDGFRDVWTGIREALDVGLNPVKLNCIVLKGINDDEIADFVRLTIDYPLIVRFIEFFPTNKRSKELTNLSVANDEIKRKIASFYGELKPFSGIQGNGPAEYYRCHEAKGAVGFISSFTKDFCRACNRIRVDCAGRVSPCLFSGHVYDIKPFLRDNQDDAKLFVYLKNILGKKHAYKNKTGDHFKIEMSSIGG